MNFRQTGFNNRFYSQHGETIGNELNSSIKWSNKMNEITKRYTHNNDIDRYSWKTLFDKLEHETFLEKNKFKEPKLNFPPPKKSPNLKQKEKNKFESISCFDFQTTSNQLKEIDIEEEIRKSRESHLDQILNSSSSNVSDLRRRVYLNERRRAGPIQKYIFPLTASMNYGWLSTAYNDDDIKNEFNSKTQLSNNNNLNIQSERYIQNRTNLDMSHGKKNAFFSNYYRTTGALINVTEKENIKLRIDPTNTLNY
jgi:hypothetical protein